MVFWNSLEIPQPPTNTCKVSTSVFRSMDLLNLKSTFSSASITLNELTQLHVEAALLSRTLYKNKIAFRSHKGFKKLEKINRGLLRYLAFDLNAVYKTFYRMLPDHSEDFQFVLPTKQMLEWVLVRTQGFAKLFCVIADSCEEASCFWKTNIQRGELFNVSVLFLGIVSRIWSYSRYLVHNACIWFSKLRPHLNLLEYNGTAWLPHGYEIPKDLAMWLNSPHTKSHPLPVNMQINNDSKHLFAFIDIQDGGSSVGDKLVQAQDYDNDEFPVQVDDGKKHTTLVYKTNGKKPLPVPQLKTGSPNFLSFVGMEAFGETVPRNTLFTKKKAVPLENSEVSVDLNKPNASKPIKTESKKGKKRRHDGSLHDCNEPEFNFNTTFGQLQQNKQNLSECSIPKTKKVKKLKEVLINSKIDSPKIENKNKKIKKVRLHQNVQIDNVHAFQDEVHTQSKNSKKKKKKKAKMNHSNYLFNALAVTLPKSNSATSKVLSNHGTKPFKKKKKKRKSTMAD